MKEMVTRGLAAGSLYKLLFIGLLIPVFIFSFLCGVASYFGHATVSINGVYVYGLKGLAVGSILGVVLPIILSAFLWCIIGFGVWIWCLMRKITLVIRE